MYLKCMVSILFSGLFMSLGAQKNIEQIFRKYKNDEGVVNMNFTGEVLKMMNNADAKIKSTVEIVDILVFNENEDISNTDKDKISDVLLRDKFDLLIDVRNKTQKVKLYAVEAGSFLSKVYAHVNSPELNAYFVLTGKIVFEELAKLGMDFQSGDALKILDGSKKK
jgi:Domain of unknown function (DUF4252)